MATKHVSIVSVTQEQVREQRAVCSIVVVISEPMRSAELRDVLGRVLYSDCATSPFGMVWITALRCEVTIRRYIGQ